jgi:iron-sulfur cluster assembly protein
MLITPQAQEKLRALLPQPDCAYRLRAIPGGCQGYTYDLKIVTQPQPDDVAQTLPGFTLYIEAQSVPSLTEVVMDYVEGLVHSGFVFHHPNSCACGQSFAPDTCPSSQGVPV